MAKKPTLACDRCLRLFHTPEDAQAHFRQEHDLSIPSLTFQDRYNRTIREIKLAYETAIRPVETAFSYDTFSHDWFSESLKSTRPFVLFLGPFSSGKTSFINYLLGGDYLHTGPEPTTNRFNVILYGEKESPIPGRILANKPDLPLKALQDFGNDFLENLSGFECPAEVLRSVTLIDTPGVLESATDIHSRSYDYVKVCKWFAERADLIFVLFDPTKLDSGNELRALFQTLRGKEAKLRMVLNKADTVQPHMLMRVYGSLFWNLSNLVHTSEPPRVYVSSFWNKPYMHPEFSFIFDQEKADLLYDMVETIPMQALDQRISHIMRRARLVQIFACIVGTIRDRSDKMFFAGSELKKQLKNLDSLFEEVAMKYRLIRADFPEPEAVQRYFAKLSEKDLSKVPKLTTYNKETAKALPGGIGALDRLVHIIDRVLPALLSPLGKTSLTDPREFRRRFGAQGLNAIPMPQLPSEAAGGLTAPGALSVQRGLAVTLPPAVGAPAAVPVVPEYSAPMAPPVPAPTERKDAAPLPPAISSVPLPPQAAYAPPTAPAPAPAAGGADVAALTAMMAQMQAQLMALQTQQVAPPAQAAPQYAPAYEPYGSADGGASSTDDEDACRE